MGVPTTESGATRSEVDLDTHRASSLRRSQSSPSHMLSSCFSSCNEGTMTSQRVGPGGVELPLSWVRGALTNGMTFSSSLHLIFSLR